MISVDAVPGLNTRVLPRIFEIKDEPVPGVPGQMNAYSELQQSFRSPIGYVHVKQTHLRVQLVELVSVNYFIVRQVCYIPKQFFRPEFETRLNGKIFCRIVGIPYTVQLTQLDHRFVRENWGYICCVFIGFPVVLLLSHHILLCLVVHFEIKAVK